MTLPCSGSRSHSPGRPTPPPPPQPHALPHRTRERDGVRPADQHAVPHGDVGQQGLSAPAPRQVCAAPPTACRRPLPGPSARVVSVFSGAVPPGGLGPCNRRPRGGGGPWGQAVANLPSHVVQGGRAGPCLKRRGVRSGKVRSGCRAVTGDVTAIRGGGYWRLAMRLGLVLGYGNAFWGRVSAGVLGGGGG